MVLLRRVVVFVAKVKVFAAFGFSSVGPFVAALAVNHVNHVVDVFFWNEVVGVWQVERFARVLKCQEPIFVDVNKVGHFGLVRKRVKVKFFSVAVRARRLLRQKAFVFSLRRNVFVKVVGDVGFGKMLHVVVLVNDKFFAGFMDQALQVVADVADVLDFLRLVFFHLNGVNRYRA